MPLHFLKACIHLKYNPKGFDVEKKDQAALPCSGPSGSHTLVPHQGSGVVTEICYWPQCRENKWPWRASPTWDTYDTASTFNVATVLGKRGQNQDFCKTVSWTWQRCSSHILSTMWLHAGDTEAEMTTWIGEGSQVPLIDGTLRASVITKRGRLRFL